MAAKVGRPAPDFCATALMPDGSFGEVKLADYKGKYLILFFYPLDFTFVCPSEIVQFSDAADAFTELNCAVLAASVDSQFSHLAWTEKPRREGGLGQMKIPIIADLTKKVSNDYGVLIEEGPDAGVALRGLFIINPEGVLRQATINDLPVGRNVDEVLRLLKAFQFVDEHGEVCPAGWKPGDKGMKADTTGSKEWFSEHGDKKRKTMIEQCLTMEVCNNGVPQAVLIGGEFHPIHPADMADEDLFNPFLFPCSAEDTEELDAVDAFNEEMAEFDEMEKRQTYLWRLEETRFATPRSEPLLDLLRHPQPKRTVRRDTSKFVSKRAGPVRGTVNRATIKQPPGRS